MEKCEEMQWRVVQQESASKVEEDHFNGRGRAGKMGPLSADRPSFDIYV